MFICSRCHSVFENPTVLIETHGLERSPYEYEAACPACRSTDFYDAVRCHKCGEAIAADEAHGGFCESCAKKILERFQYMLNNEFDTKELWLLDATIDGIGITEPGILKINV